MLFEDLLESTLDRQTDSSVVECQSWKYVGMGSISGRWQPHLYPHTFFNAGCSFLPESKLRSTIQYLTIPTPSCRLDTGFEVCQYHSRHQSSPSLIYVRLREEAGQELNSYTPGLESCALSLSSPAKLSDG